MPARFSYIDAKGKEVEIGGTAQLMQRIRLGAIDGSTHCMPVARLKATWGRATAARSRGNGAEACGM